MEKLLPLVKALYREPGSTFEADKIYKEILEILQPKAKKEDSAPKTPETEEKPLSEQYEEKFGKPVPNNKKNDQEWIKTKISE